MLTFLIVLPRKWTEGSRAQKTNTTTAIIIFCRCPRLVAQESNRYTLLQITNRQRFQGLASSIESRISLARNRFSISYDKLNFSSSKENRHHSILSLPRGLAWSQHCQRHDYGAEIWLLAKFIEAAVDHISSLEVRLSIKERRDNCHLHLRAVLMWTHIANVDSGAPQASENLSTGQAAAVN